MRRTLVLGIVLVGAAAGAAGCAVGRPRAYFAADRTRGEAPDATPIATHNFVPVDSGERRLRVAAEARMYEDEPIEGLLVPTLCVRVYIGNYGESHFEVRADSFTATDDMGQVFPLAQCVCQGRRTGVVVADPPSEAVLDLVFRLPDGYDVERPRSIRLGWGFRLGEQEVHHETVFERRGDRPFRNPFYEAGRS